MQFQPGDKVKFLNTSGGGIVTRIISPGIVGVAIEDGFEIPTAINEIVKTGDQSPASRYFSAEPKSGKAEGKTSPEPAPSKPAPREEKPLPPASGEHITPLPASWKNTTNPSGVYLFFEPADQKWLITGPLYLGLINLSEYDVLYSFFHKSRKGGFMGRDYGSIPPYSKLTIDMVPHEDLEYVADGVVQLMWQREAMPKVWMPVSASFRIRPVRFIREDNYRSYGFTDRKAFVYLLSETAKLKSMQEHEEGLKYGEEEPRPAEARQVQPESFITRHKTAPREAEVDLHIEQMVEDHRTLKPEEILNLQLAYFTRCMEAAIMDKYYKVTFIHGIGNGILKRALKEKLKDYSNIYYQQAPVARYGMGALEIMIMHKQDLA